MKKYKVTQTYTVQDIYENVEANSKEEAILKLGEQYEKGKVETQHFETETEVIENSS